MSEHSILADMGLTFVDPYPLPTDDACKWILLLSEAYDADKELFYILTYLRAVGTILEPTGNSNMPYKITPIISENNWSSQEEWDREKQALAPYAKKLIGAMKKI